MTKGWRQESARHSLARKGIKTKTFKEKEIGLPIGKYITTASDIKWEMPEGETFEHTTSKKVIHHPDGFDYKFDIVSTDLYEASGEEDTKGKYLVTLNLVPTAKSLGKKQLRNVAETSGIKPKNVTIQDIEQYRYGVPLKSITTKQPTKEIKKFKRESIAVKGLIGFYLDKPYNRMGNTGWDLLRDSGALKSDLK